MNSFSGLARSLAERPRAITLFGAPEGHDAATIGSLAAEIGGKTWVHVCRDDGRMARFAEALAFFHPELNTLTFPAWDCLPYDRVSPNGEITSRRIDTLTRLAGGTEPTPLIVLTTVNALVRLLKSLKELLKFCGNWRMTSPTSILPETWMSFSVMT